MPTAWKALSALPWSVMPWPTPPSDSRWSTRTTSTSRWRRASARTAPVMPPPTTRTRLISDMTLLHEHGRTGAGDPADDVVAVGAGGGQVGDELAAVEDDHPVGHLVAERQVVGDHDDRDARVGHPADQALDVLGLLVAQRRGRLVEQQDPLRLTIHADRAARQGDDLALAA